MIMKRSQAVTLIGSVCICRAAFVAVTGLRPVTDAGKFRPIGNVEGPGFLFIDTRLSLYTCVNCRARTIIAKRVNRRHSLSCSHYNQKDLSPRTVCHRHRRATAKNRPSLQLSSRHFLF